MGGWMGLGKIACLFRKHLEVMVCEWSACNHAGHLRERKSTTSCNLQWSLLPILEFPLTGLFFFDMRCGYTWTGKSRDA